jgi:hypothetical protein
MLFLTFKLEKRKVEDDMTTNNNFAPLRETLLLLDATVYRLIPACFSADKVDMSRVFTVFSIIFLIASGLNAQNAAVHSETLRGEVWVELEPIHGLTDNDQYPLDIQTASRRALEEAALYYSAMIYGWTFHYDVGERARRISEEFSLAPVSAILFGDPGLQVTSVDVQDMQVRLWTDYHLSADQQRRMQVWRQGTTLSMQGVGYCPLDSTAENSDWMTIKMTALEDAGRAALRAALRASERNRPKEVTGYIRLASFPRFFFSSGRMAASARFKVEISEIIPFAAY